MNPQNNQTNLISEEKEILKEERQILEEERKILKEEKTILKRIKQNLSVSIAIIIFIIGAAAIGFAYIKDAQSKIYIDKAQIQAPSIDMAPENSGVLKEVYVHEGDIVSANTPLAMVGDGLIKSKIGGLIISVKNDIGKIFNRGESVVTMINPEDLKLTGRIAEDKGLKDIHVGQQVVFTVDAYGAKEYIGTVDEISPTSMDSGIAFNISDRRETREFTINVRFDINAYPELKNGMSAKMWVSK